MNAIIDSALGAGPVVAGLAVVGAVIAIIKVGNVSTRK
jgi:hypothetical protein